MNALHVYSARCSWHGPIENIGLLNADMKVAGKVIKSPGLPCCPFCKSVLLQIDEKEWNDGAKKHEEKGHANYLEFLKWGQEQQQCWPTVKMAMAAFFAATGKEVQS